MAAIPQLEISDRRLETSPSLHRFPSLIGENARAVGGAVNAAANGLDRIMEVQRRADEREAEYSVLQADNFVRNGWLGSDVQDPQTGEWTHNPGVADRSWEQMRDDGTTALDEMRRLQKAVKGQKFYTDLSPAQRRVFERKWLFKADEHSRAAQRLHLQLTRARIADETRRTVEMRGAEVAENYGADDLVYTRIAGRNALLNWAEMQGTALKEETRAMLDDPRCSFNDIAKSQGWDEKTRQLKLEEYRKTALAFDVNRITALQRAAANNQRLGGYDPESVRDGKGNIVKMGSLDKADAIADGLLKAKHITAAQANAVKAETQKARRSYEMLLSKQQGDNAAKIDARLDEIQWKMAYPLAETGGRFDPSRAVGVETGDENRIIAELQQAVNARQISFDQGNRLLARCQKLRDARNQLFSDMQHPEQFAARSDAAEWVRLKQMIADADRDNTPAERIEAAVEAAKPRLSAKDYFGLWHDARQRRNAEDDRIANQVFSAFLGVGEGEVAIAVDPARRGTMRSDDAISTLLGSPNAEYVQSGRWIDPDFTVEDVDEAHRLVRDYLVRHPGDRAGADRLLRDLVEPASRAARAKSFRDRIMQLRRYERTSGNAGVFSVQRAFGAEDGGKAAKPADKTDSSDK